MLLLAQGSESQNVHGILMMNWASTAMVLTTAGILCRVVHSPDAVQGRDAVEEVCDMQHSSAPSRFDLVAGEHGIRWVQAMS